MKTHKLTHWQAKLADAGYPINVTILDFETYFDTEYSLRRMSTIEYVKDNRFECLGVAVYESKSGTSRWYPDAWPAILALQAKYSTSLEGCTVVAQNAKFDLAVLTHHFGLAPQFFVDLLGIARHVHPQESASLADMCRLYGLADKGDTMSFKGMTRRERWRRKGGRTKAKDMLIRQPIANYDLEKAMGEYALNDADREWELFTHMLPRFSNAPLELPLMQHTIELFLKPTLRVDRKRAERIRKDMIHEVDKAAKLAGYTRDDISGNISFRRILTDALELVGESLPLKANKNGKLIPAIAKTDQGFLDLINHPIDTIRHLMEARAAIRSWPSKAKRVHNIIKQSDMLAGTLPVPLWYYGAHTGRWSGAERINLQNLGAHGHPLDAEVRNVLLPPQNHVFIIADQSAVEARGTAWIAGQNDLLAKFANGEDVYCDLASVLFDTPVRRPTSHDPLPVRDWLKAARNCGKVGVLGGGYGMGPLKCQAYGKGYGLSLSLGDATRIIDTYRDQNPKIVQYWKDVIEAFRWAYKTGREAVLGPLKFYQDRNYDANIIDTIIRLPSGRELRYADIQESLGEYGPELTYYSSRQKTWSKVYGGYLTENIIQGICRDTIAENILGIERAGYRVPLHVHDEVVVNALTHEAEQCLNVVLTIMKRSPVWAADLPLDAEGSIVPFYGK